MKSNWKHTLALASRLLLRDWRAGELTVLASALLIAVTAMTGVAVSIWPFHPVSGGLAALAALAHGLRLSGWRGMATAPNPLLFVLHGGYAWLPAGYAVLALSVFGLWITPSAATHVLTMGAIASVVLAVITRVALGHTGRALVAPKPILPAQ